MNENIKTETNGDNIKSPLTKEIIKEASLLLNKDKRKDEMIDLMQEFLIWVEKYWIKEICFSDKTSFLEKWKAILYFNK